MVRISPSAQAWGYCGNIRNEADARSLVGSGEATALVTARVAGDLITSYRTLVGHVTGLRTLQDGLTVPRGRYLILLGGWYPSYYAAFGSYGIYRIAGRRAFQVCAYGQPNTGRTGVFDVDRLVALLSRALRA